MSNIPKVTSETNDVVSRVNWSNIKDSELHKYYNNTNELLGKIKLPIDAIKCQNMKCQNYQHKQDLQKFYSGITDSLTEASAHLNKKSTNNYTHRPGWTEYVSELYDYSKTCRQIWLDSNVPRQGIIHENYVKSRARFKYAMKFISKNEQKMRKEAMAKNLANKDKTEFWKDIAKNNNSKTPLPDHIDEGKGTPEILSLWKKHFHDIFNCIKNENNIIKPFALEEVANEIAVSYLTVKEAIKELSINKSCGLDGITAEHLKYASERLIYLLSMAITGFFVHGFLPESMLSVLIVPVIKDKAGNINSKDNYRPIALASIISKIVETIMLNRMETYLLKQANQF